MTTEIKKQKSFAEIAASITSIVKKPLTAEEAGKIKSIIENGENEEKKPTENLPKVALPKDSEAST